MKKMITMMTIAAMAISMQAASLQWGVTKNFMDSSPYGDGGWANEGVDMYLFSIGYNASFTDANIDFAWGADGTTLMISFDAEKGDAKTWQDAGAYLAAYTTLEKDYDDGSAKPPAVDVGDSYIAFFGAGASNWDQVNNYLLLTLTITADGYYNFYLGTSSGFNESQKADSTGAFQNTVGFDAAGRGEMGTIPEPLTVGLALAGVALLIAQRKRK